MSLIPGELGGSCLCFSASRRRPSLMQRLIPRSSKAHTAKSYPAKSYPAKSLPGSGSYRCVPDTPVLGLLQLLLCLRGLIEDR